MQRSKQASGLRVFHQVLAVVLLLAAGCTALPTGEPTPSLAPTETLPPPQVQTTSVPPVKDAVSRYLNMWQVGDYEGMYASLSGPSRAGISLEDFSKRHQEALEQTASSEVRASLLSVVGDAVTAVAKYNVTLPSTVFGDLVRETQMNLALEEGEWRVVWDASAILPELANGNTLKMDRELQPRGAIYDRNGAPIAAQVKAASIGLLTDYVDLGDTRGLLTLLASLTQYRSDTIRTMIEQSFWGTYLALGEVAVEENPRSLDRLRQYGAVVVEEYDQRLYYRGGIAPHLIGYVSALQESEISQYQKLGYPTNARVGRKGIELWGEGLLAGKPGGALYVFDKEGKAVDQLGAVPSEPGQTITTTIDAELQLQAQRALSIYNGAIVVMERDTGRILAMASAPGFNPNAYEFENYNWNTLIGNIAANPNTPQFNRATQGQYPLGSVFKVVTIAAALESERFTEDSEYDCQYVFDELGNFPRYDWTWEHFQEDGKTKPSGLLTLPQGLIRSCNPWFWHIGFTLWNDGYTSAIADLALGFGLGKNTGIEIADFDGNVQYPQAVNENVQMSIGQGTMQVSPLQVAMFVAAVGNGGTLYRPTVIDRIVPLDGEPTYSFVPEVVGQLPVTSENLAAIQEAMVSVIDNPRGTANKVLGSMSANVAGKTGTAQNSTGEPHAWFAGYTYNNNPNKPDIAIAIILENAGEGSEMAAPLFRRVVSLYFSDSYGILMPWESQPFVQATPEPETTPEPEE